MGATFKLLNSYFWKTIYGPIIAFGLPILLLAILGNVLRVQYVYPGIIAMSIMFIGILALPLSIMELKSSSLFKYIGASPVDNKKFSIVAIGYYVFIAILTVFVILIGTMIFFHGDVIPKEGGFRAGILGGIFYTAKGVGSFLFATLLHLFMVIAFGLAIATFAKTPQQALTISIVVILPSMFLSGMILSVDIIAQSPVMQWISRLIPFRYTTGNIVVASTPVDQLGDVFALLTPDEKRVIFSSVDPQSGAISTQLKVAAKLDDGTVIAAGHVVNIKTVDDLFRELNLYHGDYQKIEWISEKTLFKLVFIDSPKASLSGSDNNMFAWTESWGVRRIPEIDQIKEFLQNYFRGDKDPKTGQYGGDASRFGTLWEDIKANNYTWLSLFLKQNNVLYTVPDRVLNTAVPVVLSVGSLYYVSKNFKWSAR